MNLNEYRFNTNVSKMSMSVVVFAGLTAIQVSGTNGIILISQPINTSPTAANSLTFGNYEIFSVFHLFVNY